MIYDISSKEMALQTLIEFTKCPEDYINHFILKAKYIYCHNYDLSDLDIRDKMVEELKINLENISIDDMNIAFSHITTSNNECLDIRKNGLRDLSKVLQEENELTKFLKEHKVFIDVKKKVISTNRGDRSIEMINSDDKEFKKYSDIGRKIYSDFAICGFFYYSLTHPYGGCVHKRPEILNEISRVVNAIDLSREWGNTHKSYDVKVVVPLCKVNTYNFCSRTYNTELKLELLNKAIYKSYVDNDMGEQICILKNDVCVLPSEIVAINRVNFDRNNM